MPRLPLRSPAARGQRLQPLRSRRFLALAGWVAVGALLAGDHGLQQTVLGFPSRPDLTPPAVSVGASATAARSAYTFVAPWRGDGQAGPMILDGRGRMVWFHPLPGQREAMDFRAQRYQGRPVLTWWEGQVNEDGYGRGEYVIADRSYREVARFRAAGERPGDFHEYLLTPRGTALITVYRPVHHDLRPVGGPRNGTVLESVVQEIDVESGRVLLDWHALDHVALAESHEEVPTEPDEMFDHFHVNSVDVDHDGNLLLSARHTDTVYKIDRRTGEVLWRLGGTRSDFALGPGARFYSQHDARRQPDGDITLFDNSNPPQRRERSRAIRLRIDEETMRATLESAVEHPLGLSSDSQGNMQTLPGGDIVVGWGSQPYFSRCAPGGRLLFGARFPEDTDVYRAYQSAWHGRPVGRPAVATDVLGNDLSVHASWNGATEVAYWQLLAGDERDELRPVSRQAWDGFETTLTTDTDPSYLAVRAVGRSGDPLAVSRTARPRR